MKTYRYARGDKVIIEDDTETGASRSIPIDEDNRDYVELAALLSAENIKPEAYEPPPTPVPSVISDRQFFQALAMAGEITQGQALAAAKTGDVPPQLRPVIAALPENQQFAAEMLLCGATQFQRDHPMTAALAAGMGWTDEQLDALWTEAAAL